jgi:hypothetical protein
MKYRLAADARPQFRLLLIATLASIALWLIPYASILAYPFRLFVTFIHEGSHALATIVTFGSVSSLLVRPDTSGLTTIWTSGALWQSTLISSAGYVGAMAFGVFLLFLIRKSVKAKLVLYFCAGIVLTLTLWFGLIKPFWTVTQLTSVPFTLVSGLCIGAGLIALGRFANRSVAQFFVGFLAVQCILNALFDLGNLFVLSTPVVGNNVATDALNMQAATHIPSIVWTFIWIGMALFLLSVGLRFYAVLKSKPTQPDLPFEAPADV